MGSVKLEPGGGPVGSLDPFMQFGLKETQTGLCIGVEFLADKCVWFLYKMTSKDFGLAIF